MDDTPSRNARPLLENCLRLSVALLLLALLLLAPPFIVSAQRVVEDTVPPPLPLIDPGEDVTIVLIFGTATSNLGSPGMADMVMLAALNRASGTVSLLAVPRDLWVYAPGAGMMKLTTTYFHGSTHREIEGGGVGLLRDTIRYNLGLEVDHYAHVNFDSFIRLIDLLGGITLSVDCIIRDWKLISPELDIHRAENYELFTLPIGTHTLDSHTALWYVRSRRTSSDLDRGRRQQDVLRAMWRKARADQRLTDLPALWEAARPHIQTDLTLDDLIGWLPFALQIDADRIEAHRFRMGTHIRNALSPAPAHSAILATDPEAVEALVRDFVAPPTPNQISRANLRVEIVNASGVRGLARVAADRLTQEGFVPQIVEERTHYRNFTAIYDYTGQDKDSPIPDLQRVLRVTAEGVIRQPDPARTADIRIYLGNRYAAWSCTRDVIQPPFEEVETP